MTQVSGIALSSFVEVDWLKRSVVDERVSERVEWRGWKRGLYSYVSWPQWRRGKRTFPLDRAIAAIPALFEHVISWPRARRPKGEVGESATRDLNGETQHRKTESGT